MTAPRAALRLATMLVVAACTTTPAPPLAPHDQAPPEAPRTRASGWVASSDDVRIRYHDSGNGPKTLVFVHGWLCDSRYWRLQVPVFERNYRVITLDLAGHGESGFGREQWSIDAFAHDVAAVVHASGAESVVLVGHSMGGPVVIDAARLLADRVIGVVGVDTLRATYFEPPPTAERESAIANLQADFSGATREFVSTTMFAPTSDPVLRESIVTDMAQGPELVGIAAIEGLLAYRPTPGLEQLQVPFVLINADFQPTDVSRVASAAQQFRFEVIPGVGHFLMLEAPEAFDAALDRAVQEFLSAAAATQAH